MSEPTNTLILTGFSESEISDKEIIQSLQDQIIKHTPSLETIKFSILKSFKRILIVFERIDSSATLYKILKEAQFKVGFSSQNNYDDFVLTPEGYKFDTREYLNLPSHGNTFIISPPPSPPNGWVSGSEEAPDNRAIYSPEELGELLYKRVEGDKLQKLFNGSVDDLQDSEEEESGEDDAPTPKSVTQEVLLDSHKLTSPIIVLEAPDNEKLNLNLKTNKKKPQKVAVPPK